jgi:hypothetical protein
MIMADQTQHHPSEDTTDTEPLKTESISEQRPSRDTEFRVSKKPRKLKRIQGENVEFEPLEPFGLKAVPVLVQALDNQWLPRSLLQPAFQAGQITERIDKRLKKAVRSEYMRSLINGQQVILNRAYLYNNPAIAQDYSKKGQQREAFKAFLEEGTIVPWLLAEKTPVDPPASGAGTISGFDVTQAFSNWQKLCQEVRVSCVRLSWDEQENIQLTRQRLSERFNTFAASAAMKDIDAFMRDLGLDESAKEGLRKRLAEVGHFGLDMAEKGRLVTRNDLYKAFITAGNNPAERMYDGSKPFGAEIKQLLDLSYNVNLPDALGGYLITPIESLPRTSLQEWQDTARQPDQVTADDILKLLQRTAFDLVGQGLNVKSMDALSLQDVREIRRMDEWTTYIQSLENLLQNPLLFAESGAERVYDSYAKLAKQITDIIAGQDRKEKILTTWSPAIELIFYIAGAILSCVWTADGATYQLYGQVSGLVGAAAAPVVARMVIRDMSERRAQQDLSTSIDFMRRKMVSAKDQWEMIKGQVKKLPGYQEVAGALGEEEIVDPILSYQEY